MFGGIRKICNFAAKLRKEVNNDKNDDCKCMVVA